MEMLFCEGLHADRPLGPPEILVDPFDISLILYSWRHGISVTFLSILWAFA